MVKWNGADGSIITIKSYLFDNSFYLVRTNKCMIGLGCCIYFSLAWSYVDPLCKENFYQGLIKMKFRKRIIPNVIPTKVGIHLNKLLDSRIHGNDKNNFT